MLQHTVIHCNTRQYIATHICTNCHHGTQPCKHTATCYITLQLVATHCNTLQHIATHCNTLQHTATHCNTLQHTATHCNTLQHAISHCNTLQHTTFDDFSRNLLMTQRSDGTHVKEWCQKNERVVSHIWKSHVTHTDESCHIWMSRVTHMSESYPTCKWVVSRIPISHATKNERVTHMNASCHTCERVIS